MKRLEWIDLSKFFVIFTMVWLHVGAPIIIDGAIHAFHMPIFFIISGFLFNYEKYSNFKIFFKKRFTSILIPYFLFAFVLYLYWCCYYYFISPEKIVPIQTFLLSLFAVNTEIIPYGCVQWFLTCLFITEIIFYFICKLCVNNKKKIIISIIIVSVIGYLIPATLSFRLAWAADTAITATVFYGIGYLLKYKSINNKFFILGVILPVTILLNGYVNMRQMQYGNYFLFYFNAIVASVLIFLISYNISKYFKNSSIKNNKYINYIYNTCLFLGQNTLYILLLNRFFDYMIREITHNYLYTLNSYISFLLLFLETIIILILMIPIITTIKIFKNKLISSKN